jgi:hypothetical protein
VEDPELVIKELQAKMQTLADSILGPSKTTMSPFAPVSSITKRIQNFEASILEARNSNLHAQTKLPSLSVPTFDGSDLEAFLKEFQRWMRLSGVDASTEKVQLDWLLQACTPKVKRLVEKVVEEKVYMGDVLRTLEDLYPKLENDISLRSSIEKVPSLPANPDPAIVAQLFLELEELFARMTKGSMSDQEKFLVLVKKLHPKTFGELRGDRHYKHRTEDYGSLKEAILEKVKEDWLERHLFQQKNKCCKLWRFNLQTCPWM